MRGFVAPLVALLMASLALAGCLEGTGDSGLPNVALIAPADGPKDLPPCHLEPGRMEPESLAPVLAPLGPTSATIKTDAYGVSHVYADDAYSLWYANGYVQARDRLFMMDVLRLVGHGEASRHLGPGQLGLDYEIHRELYTTEELQAQLDASPEGTQLLQAYADGVNRFMAEAIGTDQWPFEFAAVGRTPPPWQPIDSAAIVAYLIGFFGVAGGSELSNLRLLGQLESTLGTDDGWTALEDSVWLTAEDTYTSIHPNDLVLNGCEQPTPQANELQRKHVAAAADAKTFGSVAIPPETSYFAAPDRGVMTGFKWGSNAMVVDGRLTETGSPMMWGAPQMGYYKPPVPYQIGLHGAGYDAAGIGVTGAPGIVIGRNPHMAWTATSGNGDQVDLVSLELAGDRQYMWDGEIRDMDCWFVEHPVLPSGSNAAAPQVHVQEVCRAHGWPVVAINEDAGVAWMSKTTTRHKELAGALKWLQAPLMTDRESLRELMGDFPFSFNFLVADHEGVGMIHTGNQPLRAPGLDPRLPTPAGSAYDWVGEVYGEQMGTWVTDPSTGYIANWNNAPVYGWRAGDQAGLWGPTQRVQQIEYWMQQALANTGNALSLEDVKWVNWQAATHDSYALSFMPHLIAAAASDPELADAHQALHSWFAAELPWRDDDNDGTYDDPGHAVWDIVIQDLFDRITSDEMGPLTRDLQLGPAQGENNGDHGTGNNHYAILLKILEGSTRHDWCDDLGTMERETCAQQLKSSVALAQQMLRTKYGPVEEWREPVHHAQFFPFGAYAADERPMVNRGSWVQMVSMAESDKSGSVMPPGNSGLITTAEYAGVAAGGPEPERLTAELDLYWTNQFKPFPLTGEEVDDVAVSVQTLAIA